MYKQSVNVSKSVFSTPNDHVVWNKANNDNQILIHAYDCAALNRWFRQYNISNPVSR